VLKIFIDKKNFECLRGSLPAGSHSKSVLDQAVHFANVGGLFLGSNFVVTCTDAEARNLLMYAIDKCPGTASIIAEALREEGLIP
jgi:hypothetical protein